MKQEKVKKYTVEATGLNVQGQGLARTGDGLAVFVPGLLPGEQAEIRLVEKKRNYALGRITKLLQSSPDRIPSACPVSRHCGGCSLREFNYPAQLREKERHVRNCLERIGGFSAEELEEVFHPILGMEQPEAYRSKVQLPCSGTSEAPRFGYYGQRSHEVVDTDFCPLHPPRIMSSYL